MTPVPAVYSSVPIQDGTYSIETPYQGEGWYVVAHEAKIAKERREAAEIYEPLREIVRKVWRGGNEYSSRTVLIEAPWPLRWFGEDGYKAILVPYNTPADEIVRLEGLFPEASVVRQSERD